MYVTLMTFTNAIWILTDQQPQHMLGCNGNPNVNTPEIDRLAKEGINFRQAVSGCPLCCPFRGSLLSSRYPHEAVAGHERQLDPSLPTVATAFREHGYHTGYFGKWHVDGWRERDGRSAMHIVPPERRGGFDTWIGYENNNSQYDCWVHGGDGEEAFHYRLPGYETDCLTDLLIKYLEERAANPDQPFFAVLSVQPPHNPYVAPAEYMCRHHPEHVQFRPNVPDVEHVRAQARAEMSGAHAMVENMDWNLGRVRAKLIELGLWDETALIYFSDHGDMHGSHGQFRKTSPWEESMRVPFIIGGGVPYDGRRGRSDAVINHVDIAPTTLGLCGLESPEWMRGFDYSGCVLRERPHDELPDSAFIQLVDPTRHADSVDRPWRSVVTRDGWKYTALEGQPWLLFDLNTDRYEQVNLAHNTRFKTRRSELNARLARWISETGDVFAVPVLD